MNNNKPTTLLIEEFKQNLSQTINDSGLPLFIIEYIMKDAYNEVHDIARQVIQKEISEYNKKQELKEEQTE